jgi:hypothetical protein
MLKPSGFPSTPDPALRQDAEAERRRRLAAEAAIIAKAEADVEAGFGIEEHELEAWLDELEHHPDAPLPVKVRHDPGVR